MKLFPTAELREKGAIMIIMAASMIMLLGVTAIVIDVANFQQLKRQAQATVDASVLAGAPDIDDYDEAARFVRLYAADNLGVSEGAWNACTDGAKDAAMFTAQGSYDCISVSDDGDTLRVKLPTRSATTYFASIFGFGNWKVNVFAEAEVVRGAVSDESGGPFKDANYDITKGDPGGGYGICENLAEMDGVWNTDSDGNPTRATLAIFVFEHTDKSTTVLCTSSSRFGGGNLAVIPCIGGSTPYQRNCASPDTDNMQMHISCSESWQHGTSGEYSYPPENGWAVPGKGDPLYPDTEGHYKEPVPKPSFPKEPRAPEEPDPPNGDPPKQKDIDKYEKKLLEYEEDLIEYQAELAAYQAGIPTNWGPNLYSPEGRVDWVGIQPSGDVGDPEWRVLRAIMVKTEETGEPKSRDAVTGSPVCPGKNLDAYTPGEEAARIRLSN